VTRALALLAGLLCVAAHAAEPQLPNLRLSYAVTWKNIHLGDATITLKAEGGPDCYRYESLTDPVGLVRMFYGKPRETSEFCIKGGRVVPRRFAFLNPKDDSESFTLEFDTAAGKVTGKDGKVRDIPENAQDRFGIQQAVRLWVLSRLEAKEPGTVDITMVDQKRIRSYRFAITRRETIEIPAGRFETVLVQRVDHPRRTGRYWLAPNRDYMPVKVEQVKDGVVELRMVLEQKSP